VILNVFFTEWNKKPVSVIQIVCKINVCGYQLGSRTSMYLRGSGQVQKLKMLHITFCLAAIAEQSHRAVAPTLKFPGWKNTTTGHFSAGTGPANSQVKTYIDDSRKNRESCIPQFLFSSFFSQNELKSFAHNFPVSAPYRSKWGFLELNAERYKYNIQSCSVNRMQNKITTYINTYKVIEFRYFETTVTYQNHMH
jgi:hypothetical protein